MVRLELIWLNHRLGLAGVHVAGPSGAVSHREANINRIFVNN